MMQSFSTLIIGVSISLYFSWKLTLVAIISIPVVLAACYFESKLATNYISNGFYFNRHFELDTQQSAR